VERVPINRPIGCSLLRLRRECVALPVVVDGRADVANVICLDDNLDPHLSNSTPEPEDVRIPNVAAQVDLSHLGKEWPGRS